MRLTFGSRIALDESLDLGVAAVFKRSFVDEVFEDERRVPPVRSHVVTGRRRFDNRADDLPELGFGHAVGKHDLFRKCGIERRKAVLKDVAQHLLSARYGETRGLCDRRKLVSFERELDGQRTLSGAGSAGAAGREGIGSIGPGTEHDAVK